MRSHAEQVKELPWTELAYGGWHPPSGGGLLCCLTSTQGHPWGKLETYVENISFFHMIVGTPGHPPCFGC